MGGYIAVRGGESRVRQINSGCELQRVQAMHALKGHMISNMFSAHQLQGLQGIDSLKDLMSQQYFQRFQGTGSLKQEPRQINRGVL